MSKIISFFLSQFIKIDNLERISNKPSKKEYRHFKDNDSPIVETFIKFEHKDYK